MTSGESRQEDDRAEVDLRVLAALTAWRGGRGVGEPRPAQLAALAAGPQLTRRQVSAALQRLKAAKRVVRSHLGWELPPAPAQEEAKR